MSGIIKNIFGRSTLSVSNFSKPPQMAALYLAPRLIATRLFASNYDRQQFGSPPGLFATDYSSHQLRLCMEDTEYQ